MKSPFKFLDSYTKDDREIFFGRDREIEELYQRVFDSKLMLVYGVSGTGKSSLIHCGLANKFLDTDWLPLVIRRGGNIIESMASAIKTASITDQQSKFTSPGDFRKGVRSLYLDHYKPVFFIFDQFEELFIFGDKEERKSFIHIVKLLTESDLQCRMIFVMREEYMAGITEFEKFIPTIFSNRVRIEKMSHVNAMEAIKEPCKVYNISLEEGFAESLLEKLSPGETDVELTYLQVFLDKVYRLAAGFNPPLVGAGESTPVGKQELASFTLELLTKIGNVSDLLGSFLDDQISLLDNPDLGLTVLKSFVSIKGTKRQMSPGEVSDFALTLGKQIDEGVLQEMIQRFIHLRILRDKDQNGRYELRHDAIATKIYEKITLIEKEVLEIRQFIENAYTIYEKRKTYLEPDDLNYIAPYEDKLFVNKTLSNFIENSKRNIYAKKRAFSRILSYSAVGFFIIILSLAIYYFRSNVTAKSEGLTLEAFLQTDISPSLSFLTALNAYNKDTTSTIALKALFDSFYKMLDNGPYQDTLGNKLDPQKAIFDFSPCISKINYAEFSKDGKYIYGFLEDNTINIWDIKGKLLFSKRENFNPVISLKLSPDNEYIAAAFLDSTATIWNFKGESIYKTSIVFDPLNPLDIFDFSPNHNIMTIIKGNNRITVYNLEDSTYYEMEGHTREINGAVFSPDGKLIASASKDSTIIIWQYNDSIHHFEKAIRLNKIRSIVYSVDFSNSTKYILFVTDPVNNPVNICDLYGKKVFSQYFYNDTSSKKYISRYPGSYSGRYFSADFTANDEAIIISTFSDILSLSQKLSFDPSMRYQGYNYHRIIYSSEGYNLIPLNKFLKRHGLDRKKKIIEMEDKFIYSYSGVDVSPNYFATNISGTDYTVLTCLDRLPIKRFDGIGPSFSPDGNLLLCIDDKNLKLYPVSEKEIKRLVTKELIFGNLKTDLGKWIHFFKES